MTSQPDPVALVTAPLRALVARGEQGIVPGAVLEGLEMVAPIMNVVEAQVAAAEVRAELAVRGAQDHESRAARVGDELRAMQEREEARWTTIGNALGDGPDEDDFDPDDLAALLAVGGPAADPVAFDQMMRNPGAVLKLGPSQTTTVPRPRNLKSVALQADQPPIGQLETDAFLAASTSASTLANAAVCGACVRVTSGDAVLLGDGTYVTVREGGYERRRVAEAPDPFEEARELSTFRLATGKAPVLTPSARAALVACLHAREASVISDSASFGPYVLFGAATPGSSEPMSQMKRLVKLAQELRRAGGNSSASAAALLAVAYMIFRVHVREGDPLGTTRLSEVQSPIDVGRVRWCRLSDVPVFWLPLASGDPDLVGGADQPWTLDIPAAGATWHPQSPVMSLDPDWHARIVVSPGDANLWCIDPEGAWWSLDSDFEAVLESRRAHIQSWLEALETMEREVPARIDQLTAAAKAEPESRHVVSDRAASPGDLEPAGEPAGSPSGPEPFSKEWVLDRAKRYAYQDDGAARAAGAKAARDGYYSREGFLTVVRWKSARALPLAERNTAGDIERAARAAFDATDDVTRVAQLISLEGVGIPVASALLHFAFPDTYPILDFRALHTLGDTKRRTQYSPAFWGEYVRRCQDLAAEAGVSIRDLDKALWQDSSESGPGGRRQA